MEDRDKRRGLPLFLLLPGWIFLIKTKLYAVAAMSALLTACQGGQALPPPPASQTQAQSEAREFTSLSLFTAQNNATGETVRVFPTKEATDAFRLSQAGVRETQATGVLTYHGGPIQTAPKMYVVFWGSAWNGTGDPNGVKSRMLAFLGIIGGSGWLNSVTQYTQTGGQHVGNAAGSLVGSYVDTTSSPPSRPTQTQLAAEAAKAAAVYGDYSSNAAYIVALPHGIKPSGFGTQYCAYHSSTTAAGHTIAWTNDPYLPDVGSSCGASSVNANSPLDGVSIVFGHEQGETETDPFPNTGWLSNNSENGDLCAWTNLINNPAAGGYPPSRSTATPRRAASRATDSPRAFGAPRTKRARRRPGGLFLELLGDRARHGTVDDLCPCGHTMTAHAPCRGDRLRAVCAFDRSARRAAVTARAAGPEPDSA